MAQNDARQMALVFTDLEKSVAWKHELGIIDYTRWIVVPHDTLFADVVRIYHPRSCIRSDTGDGFLASFVSQREAILACLHFQHALRLRDWGLPDLRDRGLPVSPRVRIGIHAGEVELVQRDFEGEKLGEKLVSQEVDLASRVMGLALPGQILVTNHVANVQKSNVRELPAANEMGPGQPVDWRDAGWWQFKGSGKPEQVYEVGVCGEAPFCDPGGSEKARRFYPHGGPNWRPNLNEQPPRVPWRGDWILQRRLGGPGFGEDGTGEVWLAERPSSGRRMLQVFKFGQMEQHASLEREFRAHDQLTSNTSTNWRPDLAKLDDKLDEAPYFLATSYREAGSLRDWAGPEGGLGQCSPQDRIEFIAQVADALHAAHEAGVVHGNLKAAKILIEPRDSGPPRPVLTGFGSGRVTEPGAAPRTRASDIRALGEVLLQTVVGDLSRPPVEGWDDVNDAYLRYDIARCLLPASQRFGSAAELAGNLRGLEQRRKDRQSKRARQAAEANASADQAEAVRARAETKRWRRRVVVIAGLALLFLGLAGLALWQYSRAETARGAEVLAHKGTEKALDESERAKEATRKALNDTERVKQETERQLYLTKIQAALRAWAVERRPAWVKGVLTTAPAEYRDWEWYYLNGLLQGDLQTLSGPDGGFRSVAFSPREHLLAAGGEVKGVGGVVRLWNVKDPTQALDLAPPKEALPGPVTAVAFADAGGQLLLAAATGNEVFLWEWQANPIPGGLQFRRKLTAQAGPVRCLAFTQDGERLACGDDRAVRVWKTTTGDLVRQIPDAHGEPILAVAFSADGKRLATGSGGPYVGPFPAPPIPPGEIKVWDTTNWQTTVTIHSDLGAIYSLAFGPTPEQPGLEKWPLASGSFDATVRVWRVKEVERPQWFSENLLAGEAARRFSTDVVTHEAEAVFGVAFSPDGKRVASASGDQTVRLGDAERGSAAQTDGREDLPALVGHTGYVYGVAFSPDGGRVASASADGTVKLWGTTRNLQTVTFRGHDLLPLGVAFGDDGRRAVSVSLDGTAYVWETRTGELVCQLGPGEEGKATYAVADNPGAVARVATGGPDGQVRIWDFTGATPSEPIGLVAPLRTLPAHAGTVYALAFNHDGSRLASAGADGAVKIRDTATGAELPLKLRHDGAVHAVAFSPDRTHLASAGDDGIVRIWDVAGGNQVHALQGHSGAVYCLAYQRDGLRLASGGADKTIRIWDVESGKEARPPVAGQHTEAILGLAYDPDPKSNRLASASKDTSVRMWDTVSGEQVFVGFHNHAVYCVAFDARGRRLASGSGVPETEEDGSLKAKGVVKVWDATPGFPR